MEALAATRLIIFILIYGVICYGLYRYLFREVKKETYEPELRIKKSINRNGEEIRN